MKKLVTIVSVIAASFVFSSAFAKENKETREKKQTYARDYGMAGCGLGAVVVGKKGGQIFASTTNGTSFNQLFGITFGTLNCVDGPMNEVAMNMDKFVAANQLALNGDIAKGNGETIAALTQVMGCSVDSKVVGKVLKSNYNQIFGEDNLKPNEVTDGILSVIIDNSSVVGQCSQLG